MNEKRIVSSFDTAYTLAVLSGSSCEFDSTEYDESGFTGVGQRGIVEPCGCANYSTVLSDGSSGWGGWDDLCGFHAGEEMGWDMDTNYDPTPTEEDIFCFGFQS